MTGKRVIRVDGKEVLRHDWLFKLVGAETFKIGKHLCKITIDAGDGLGYEYALNVDGKPLQKFIDNFTKVSEVWKTNLDGKNYRIVLEKGTLDIWVNGQKIDVEAGFNDGDGTETVFGIDEHRVVLKTISTGDRRKGMNHVLYIDDQLIETSRD